MAEDERPQINMSSIKVAGIGGLGMVAMVCVMAVARPEIGAFVLLSGAGGIVAGTALIAYRRWVKPEPPHGPTLMVDTAARTVADSDAVRIDSSVKFLPVPSVK
jgi:hypothetical protein